MGKKADEPVEPQDDRGEEEIDAEKFQNAERDAQISCLTQLRKDGASPERYNRYADQLLAKHSKHLPLLLERLEFAGRRSDGADKQIPDKERMSNVVTAADALV